MHLRHGTTLEEGRARCFYLDSKGLVSFSCMGLSAVSGRLASETLGILFCCDFCFRLDFRLDSQGPGFWIQGPVFGSVAARFITGERYCRAYADLALP